MTTLAKNQEKTLSIEKSSSFSQRYNKLIANLTQNYFGLISMTILIGSCLGGITTMIIFQNDSPIWQFILGLGFSMTNLVCAISQAPTKWVFNSFVLSVFVNTCLLLLNLL